MKTTGCPPPLKFGKQYSIPPFEVVDVTLGGDEVGVLMRPIPGVGHGLQWLAVFHPSYNLPRISGRSLNALKGLVRKSRPAIVQGHGARERARGAA